jgi:predicted HTH transcriptional regulator
VVISLCGVKDKPRTLIGLKSDAFDSLDPAKLTQTLNSTLAPKIQWEVHALEVRGERVGIIYVHEARSKPVSFWVGLGGLRGYALLY